MNLFKENDFEKYSINVGIINFNECPGVLFEQEKFPGGLRTSLFKITYDLSIKHKLGENLEKYLKDNNIEFKADEKGIKRTPNGETLDEFLINRSYLPYSFKGEIYSLFPYKITLKPADDAFEFYFVLRLNQLRLQNIDNFLDHQLAANFKNDTNAFFRFIQLCIRQYSEENKNAVVHIDPHTQETIQEWIGHIKSKYEKGIPLAKTKGKETFQGIKEKIVCKADAHTIEKYFYRLVKHEILQEDEVDHILCYSFKVFSADVEQKKFTPEKVKKGELMKFVHEFFVKYSYSKIDANLWITMILIDCFTTFDQPHNTEKDKLEYIKDNWSKTPANYRFR